MSAPPVDFLEPGDEFDQLEFLDILPSVHNWNGSADSASLIGAPIPSRYHWSPIQNMVPEKAMANVEAFINVAHTQVGTMEHTSFALKRKIAICLGVSRAVATAHYQISNADLVPTETAPSMLRLGDNENMIEVLVNPTTKACYEMDTITNFSDIEKKVIKILTSATLGTVPLQGHSLLICGHHYLNEPDRQSGKVFAAVEKQFFRKGTVMASWFEPDADILRDILWHKACHPINLSIKYETAINVETKEMLVRNGVGSAASKLPAMENECRAVSNYLKLFQVVDPIWVKFGGGIDYSLLELVLDTIKRFVAGVEDHVELNPRDERIPVTVVNRRSAIMWADEVIKRNAPKAGFAFGFYEAMMKHKVYLDGSLAHQTSLRYVNSLVKLKKPQCQWPSYLMGKKYLEATTREGSIKAVSYLVD